MVSKIIFSSILSLALAQSTTITVPGIGYDETSFLASIVSANSAATTILLSCPEGEDCGLFPRQTLVYGPSTYNMDMSDPSTDFTATQDCVIAASSAICKETAGGSEANFPGSSTETYDATDVGSMILTVTKGAEKMTASASATPTGSNKVVAVASTGNGPSTSVAQATGTTSVSRSASASGSASTAAVTSTAAAAANSLVLGSGVVGVVAGLLGLFL
ncbi:hypothetical protein P153DRAFT_371637 [Dothidotthia symphoricarpi CBS 119687]|uniref:GPI anchored protein n=1 Tax=Dothidotthia symphoricarpi CBS 119687 TaxID=1392245 RepID=A0A6A5ZYI2_9PLEO|nr:uncharacterized protein P153DRAFT_371637 [Dothidotthia symphoricarpi CBS 119687]KAF2123438.1 hypothetical protein P153DRAFT_371637 [Dothidotthia symphoricarpi CBS 119687]